MGVECSEWRKQLSVDHASNLWVRLGAPREKLIIGMPTYGRSFTLSNAANYLVNAPASGGGNAGVYSREAGFLAYYEVRPFFPISPSISIRSARYPH